MSREIRGLVLRAAGTNCDAETRRALERAGAVARVRPVRELTERPSILEDVAILAIPGGFTHGDDLGAGRILGATLRVRLLEDLRAFVDRGGLVIGICNGFQVLVEAGLLPAAGRAVGEARGEAGLVRNDSGRFECRWTTVRAETDRTPWLRAGETYRLPVAHAEGKFVAPPEVRETLAGRGQVALRYVDPTGGGVAAYPANPNGSVDGIAGVVDPTGRILGLMPHPERNALVHHRPDWTVADDGADAEEPDGARMFRAAVASLG